MKINWNEPTNFSKILALVIFLLVIPTLSFYLGMQYERSISSIQDDISDLSAMPALNHVSVSPTSSTPLSASSSQDKIKNYTLQ